MNSWVNFAAYQINAANFDMHRKSHLYLLLNNALMRSALLRVVGSRSISSGNWTINGEGFFAITMFKIASMFAAERAANSCQAVIGLRFCWSQKRH